MLFNGKVFIQKGRKTLAVTARTVQWPEHELDMIIPRAPTFASSFSFDGGIWGNLAFVSPFAGQLHLSLLCLAQKLRYRTLRLALPLFA